MRKFHRTAIVLSMLGMLGASAADAAKKFCPPNCPTPTMPDAPTAANVVAPKLMRCGWVLLPKCVGASMSSMPGPQPRGISISSDDSVIDISTATRDDLSLIPTLTPAAITILSQEEIKAGGFGSPTAFARAVCATTSVDLSSVNAVIGNQLIRGTGAKKGQGFSCTAGEGSYRIADHRIPLKDILNPR
jgi:hypothetical protein